MELPPGWFEPEFDVESFVQLDAPLTNPETDENPPKRSKPDKLTSSAKIFSMPRWTTPYSNFLSEYPEWNTEQTVVPPSDIIPQTTTAPEIPQAEQVTTTSTTDNPKEEVPSEPTPATFLTQLNQYFLQTTSNLLEISNGLKSLPFPLLSTSDLIPLQTLISNAKTLLSDEQQLLKNIDLLLDSLYFHPIEMHYFLSCQNEISIQQKQLGLYEQEFLEISKGTFVPRYELVIHSQPFPESVTKDRDSLSTCPPVQVLLISNASSPLPQGNPIVQAQVVGDLKMGLKNYEQPLQPQGNNNASVTHSSAPIAQFPNLIFTAGNRLRPIRLKFVCKFTVKNNEKICELQVESDTTLPIVVKTNDNQWSEAEKCLFVEMAFGTSASQVSWFRFANWLQRRYLLATKQKYENPTRPLTHQDFDYLKNVKLKGSQTVSTTQFKLFWDWFGSLLSKLRTQRHKMALWMLGYITAFLGRNTIDSLLSSTTEVKVDPGTFIVRFSETSDDFVVAYQSGKCVEHYKLKHEEVNAAKPLPDWIRDQPDLKWIVQHNSFEPQFLKVAKEVALKDFCSPRETPITPVQSSGGYVDSVKVDQ